ncbi:hypothetical protein FEM48_Zijuj03G0183500 [Ziziphus jujuba var. spinosa]|uniref:RRM domain-containing protein n=1 Tax=Ziziphus jujuba var. spinosa TaxID=714518 RepID=A0A978VRW2_ZIZJJ|nr:hypothetical protein FEM48_Zijuj03G0183500 [Ziziphus jujuba var. spinosa]
MIEFAHCVCEIEWVLLNLSVQGLKILKSQGAEWTIHENNVVAEILVDKKRGIANLFVKNLDPSFTSGQLHSMFSKSGRILSCKIASENGKRKGFGFVQFDAEQSAMTARNALHGTLVKGKKYAML